MLTPTRTASRSERDERVLTLPIELRRRVAQDGKVLREVSRLFTDSLLGWYRRRSRARVLRAAAVERSS